MLKRQKAVTLGVFAGVLILALVVVRVALAGPGPDRGPASDLLPENKLRERRAEALPPAGAPARSGTDLLGLLQIPRDAVAGVWGFQDRALITSGVEWGRLQTPCIPPEEYDLSFTITRKRGVNSFNIGVVMGGRQGMLVLDGEDSHSTWLYLSDRPEISDNETRTAEKLLKWNRTVQLLVSVRRDGVALQVDGRKVVDWKGEASRLIFPAPWNVSKGNTLFIGSWESVFRIDDWTLIPVSGSPTILR